MSRAIWKFPLSREPVGNDYPAVMPVGAQVISAGWNQGALTVWAIVDTKEADRETRWFHIAGTGHPLGSEVNPRKLIGRVDIDAPSGMLIFHVFDGRGSVDMNQKVSL